MPRLALPSACLLLAVSLSTACASSVSPIQPRTGLVDVLKLGAEVPLEDYAEQARAAITESGWTIEKEEDERTGGRVSHTTLWIHRISGESRVDVRLDLRDGMYGIVITASQGLPADEQECVLELDEAIHRAIGLEY